MNQSSVERPSQGPYTIPPPIGYPSRDVTGCDPVVAAVETKSKGDDGSYGCCKKMYIKYFSKFSFFIARKKYFLYLYRLVASSYTLILCRIITQRSNVTFCFVFNGLFV